MIRKLGFVLALAPCVVALGVTAYAQGVTSTAATDSAATAPAPPVATTTTTQTTTAPGFNTAPPPALPQTGGDPAMFLLIGGALSGSMLALKRRFAR
ncbi:MAG TPA: LPXTG cell wall anchor domain-containing protein [Armatimonadota bacterium]|nr:LPXTG cell wall anchor domain-containing protein [Armatimonadota bacterium]